MNSFLCNNRYGQQGLGNKTIDVVLNSRLIIPTRNIEFLNPYYFEPIMIVTPKAQAIHGLLAFLSTFDYTMRIMIPACIVTLILLTFLVQKLTKTQDASLSYGMIQTICSTVCSSLANVPTSDPARIFMISCALYNYLIVSAFTSTLTSKFIIPQYMNDIKTLQQLIESHLPILTRTDLVDVYKFIEQYGNDDM